MCVVGRVEASSEGGGAFIVSLDEPFVVVGLLEVVLDVEKDDVDPGRTPRRKRS